MAAPPRPEKVSVRNVSGIHLSMNSPSSYGSLMLLSSYRFYRGSGERRFPSVQELSKSRDIPLGGNGKASEEA